MSGGLGCDLNPCNGANCDVGSSESADCTLSDADLPVFIDQFDSSEPSLAIGTFDFAFVREASNCKQFDRADLCIQATFDVIIRSKLLIDPPDGRAADSEIVLTITFNYDPCLETVINPPIINDMLYDFVV